MEKNQSVSGERAFSHRITTLYGLDEQIQCIERELSLREKLYPRWVSARKLSQQKADKEIALIRQVLATLRELEQDERGNT